MDTAHDGAHSAGDQAGARTGNAPCGGGLRRYNHEGQRGQVAVGSKIAGRGQGADPTSLPLRGRPPYPGGARHEAKLYVGPQGFAAEHDTERGGGGNARHSWVDYRGSQRIVEAWCLQDGMVGGK